MQTHAVVLHGSRSRLGLRWLLLLMLVLLNRRVRCRGQLPLPLKSERRRDCRLVFALIRRISLMVGSQVGGMDAGKPGIMIGRLVDGEPGISAGWMVA
jgi:hypothetical protein